MHAVLLGGAFAPMAGKLLRRASPVSGAPGVPGDLLVKGRLSRTAKIN